MVDRYPWLIIVRIFKSSPGAVRMSSCGGLNVNLRIIIPVSKIYSDLSNIFHSMNSLKLQKLRKISPWNHMETTRNAFIIPKRCGKSVLADRQENGNIGAPAATITSAKMDVYIF